jgi:hypothetical protein
MRGFRVAACSLLIAASAFLPGATTAAAKPAAAYHAHAAPVVVLKTCSRGYVRGIIGGQVKCLRRGEYCALRYARQYRRYGFRCYGSPARLH